MRSNVHIGYLKIIIKTNALCSSVDHFYFLYIFLLFNSIQIVKYSFQWLGTHLLVIGYRQPYYSAVALPFGVFGKAKKRYIGVGNFVAVTTVC